MMRRGYHRLGGRCPRSSRRLNGRGVRWMPRSTCCCHRAERAAREAARERSERRTRARHARRHAQRGVPQPNLPLVLDERSAHSRMVSHGDSRCASRTEQPRPSYCRRTLRRDSPRRRNIGAGTGRTAATSVPGLCFEWPSSHLSARLHCSFVPVCVTQAVRSSIHNQDRRVGSVSHTVVAKYRCHYGPPIRLGQASDGTDRAVCQSGPSASPSFCHRLQFAANARSALGRIHKRDASGEPRVSCFRSPPVNVHNFLPRRISLPSPCICRRQPIGTACAACLPGTEEAEEETDGAA
jgi:hypothetical protein